MRVIEEQLVEWKPNRRLADVEPLEQPPALRAPWSALVVLACAGVFAVAGLGMVVAWAIGAVR